MGSSIFSLAAFIVGGVIIADILIHPQGTTAASNGVNALWSTSVNGLLGKQFETVRHSIRTLGVPTRTGTGAFTVIPARSSTASFNGQNVVTGAPGTVPVRSPRPAAMVDNSWGGKWQPSAVSPDVILPSIYVARIANMQTQQGGLYSGNRVPVPAGTVNAIPKNFSKPARIGGQTVTRAVRPFVTYPVYGQ